MDTEQPDAGPHARASTARTTQKGNKMTIMERYGTQLRIYDNGGRSCDRYTIIPPRWAPHHYRETCRHWQALASDADPFHPQGFGQHVTAVPGPHLGRRIRWDELPRKVQQFARQSFPEYSPEVTK